MSKSIRYTTTTTTSSSSSSGDSGGGISYTPITRQRQASVFRAGSGLGGGFGSGIGGGGISRSVSISYGSSQAGGAGGYGRIDALAEAGVKNITTAREREKKDMQDLNSRFANYIEKNRFLEAQLKAVEQRLKELQAKWGKETAAIKEMYEGEIKQVRDLYNGAEKDKARIELRIQGLEDQLADYRRKLDEAEKFRNQDRDTINHQSQQLSDYEAELNLLRRRVGSLETDLDRESRERKRLQDELLKVTQERDAERLNNVELENRVQSLLEEIEFLKNVHDQEIKELMALSAQDSYAQNRKYWEGEMSSAIRDLQQEFDRRVDQHTSQLENYYQMKVQEVRTGQAKDNSKVEHLTNETRRLQSILSDLRAQLSDLELRNGLLEKQYAELLRQREDDLRNWDEERSRYQSDVARLTTECEKLLREVEAIMDMKLSLELEIAAYRKLLEGEETRLEMAKQASSDISRHMVSEVSSGFTAALGFGGGSISGGGGGGGGGSSSSSYDTSATIVVGGGGGGGSSSSSGGDSQSSILRGEMSQKTSFQRSAKGPLAIAECDPAGQWIEVENTGKKNESLGKWQIGRKVDGKAMTPFTFPETTQLGTTKETRSVRVYVQGKAPAGGLEYAEPTFGIGMTVLTTLINPEGEVKADHHQKTVFA